MCRQEYFNHCIIAQMPTFLSVVKTFSYQNVNIANMLVLKAVICTGVPMVMVEG